MITKTLFPLLSLSHSSISARFLYPQNPLYARALTATPLMHNSTDSLFSLSYPILKHSIYPLRRQCPASAARSATRCTDSRLLAWLLGDLVLCLRGARRIGRAICLRVCGQYSFSVLTGMEGWGFAYMWPDSSRPGRGCRTSISAVLRFWWPRRGIAHLASRVRAGLLLGGSVSGRRRCLLVGCGLAFLFLGEVDCDGNAWWGVLSRDESLVKWLAAWVGTGRTMMYSQDVQNCWHSHG